MSRAEWLEWLEVMLDLKRNDPDAYERLKAEAWEMVAANHKRKTADEIAAWKARAP